MKNKLFPMVLVVGVASVVYAAVKLISKRKTEKDEFERNLIAYAFYMAWWEKHCGEINEGEYREKLSVIYNMVAKRGETAVNELLEEAYGKAEDTAFLHLCLMNDVEDTESDSLENFIRRFPDKAFKMLCVNRDYYEYQATKSADYIAKRYYSELFRTEEQLLAYVEMLGGDTDKIKQIVQ